MSTSSLRLLLDNHFSLSQVRYLTDIPISRLRRSLSGDESALSISQQKRLARLLDPDDHERSLNVARNGAVIDGMSHAMMRHSIAIAYEGNDSCIKIASATMVQLAGRVFLATAGHVIQETRLIRFVGGNNQEWFSGDFNKRLKVHNLRGGSNIDILAWNRHPQFDVGFLELEPHAPIRLERDAIGLAKISLRPPQIGRMAFLYGYPSSYLLIRPRRSSQVIDLPIGSLTYPQPILAPSEWPDTDPLARPPSSRVDCFVKYDPSSEGIELVRGTSKTHHRKPPEVGDSIPAAQGLSGGGYWQGRASLDGFWNPDEYQLVAIQSVLDRGHLRGIQCHHWLKLVGDCYQDVREEIESYRMSHVNS